jgi:anti-anti-sigma factor
MSFDYTIERVGETISVRPEGDVSMETITVFREVLRNVVDSQEGGSVDVDMGAVTFLDSSGIGVLIAAQRAAKARGTELMVVNPGAMTRMVLQIAHLDGILVRDEPAQDRP